MSQKIVKLTITIVSAIFFVTTSFTGCSLNNSENQVVISHHSQSSKTELSVQEQKSAVRFAEKFYYNVLSGKQKICQNFTSAGLKDFLSDMNPASSCDEAVQIISGVGEQNPGQFLKDHKFSVLKTVNDTVYVKIDYPEYSETIQIVKNRDSWLAGPTSQLTN